MEETTAYKWAAQATRNCNGEPHRRQQCMDNIASALTEATAALDARVRELEAELKEWPLVRDSFMSKIEELAEENAKMKSKLHQATQALK